MTHLLDAARQYHAWGANINTIQKGKKIPLHKWKDLHSQRQDLAELEIYPWNAAGGVGVNNGPGDWHTFDIDGHKDERGRPTAVVGDATIQRLLDVLRLPHEYAWVWRGRSKVGWALAFRCDEPLPPGVLPAKKDEAGVAWGWPEKDSGADWQHLECATPTVRRSTRPAQAISGATRRPASRRLSCRSIG
jgi:Bifunctional DNA primase/polymerase, N-terminal